MADYETERLDASWATPVRAATVRKWTDNDIRNAEARGYQRAIEDAASKAAWFPADKHGSLPTNPIECAVQVAQEISAAIRSLSPKPESR